MTMPLFCILGVLNFSKLINKKKVCIISGIILFCLIGLRSVTTGGDTAIYLNAFDRVKGMSLNNTIIYGFEDVGYSVLEWIVHTLGGNFRWILLLNGACYAFVVSKYIYRCSDRVALSFLLMFSFNMVQFSISGIRQTFAISLILLALLKYWDKKYFVAGLLYFLAITMHFSSVIAIIIIPLSLLFVKEKMTKYSLVILAVVFIFRYQVASKIAILFNSYSDRIGDIELKSESGLVMCLVVIVIYTAAVIFGKKYYKTYKYARYDFAMLFMASFFEILVTTQPIFFRLAFYTLFSVVVVCPRIIEVSVSDRYKSLLSMIAYIIALIMIYGFTISSIVGGYHFLWQ